jgi:hypothetical protein
MVELRSCAVSEMTVAKNRSNASRALAAYNLWLFNMLKLKHPLLIQLSNIKMIDTLLYGLLDNVPSRVPDFAEQTVNIRFQTVENNGVNGRTKTTDDDSCNFQSPRRLM